MEKKREEQAMILAEERKNISIELEKLQTSSELQEKMNRVEKEEVLIKITTKKGLKKVLIIKQFQIKTSMKAAKDAAESIIREKNNWQEKNIHVEMQRKMLFEKENQLIKQASYLEDLTRVNN